ncbi:thiamine pyrophosphate-dependent enzyme [Bacillus sp. JJ722]|uniref:thiamine pyrophosphate-dependent enzyme n=1 Tax=Bacillus sp. JJ722 TaxID=3122973 RepID=UPI002FFDFD0D
MGMFSKDAVKVIADHRADSIVVSTMTAMFYLHEISPSPLNIDSVPLMGGASGLGLGLALSQPDRKVLVLDGDGSLLMQLGSLATIAGAKAKNFFHFVFENGVWFEELSNLSIPAEGRLDFKGMAKAAGYAAAYSFKDLEQLKEGLSSVFNGPAPAFIHLDINVTNSNRVFSKENIQREIPDFQFMRMGMQVRKLKEELCK